MPISTRLLKVVFAALAIPLLAASLSAQGFGQAVKLVEEDWYGDVKKALTDHYTGKTVRLKLPIPATRRGLEMVDGAVRTEASKERPQFAAQIGEELTIKSFRVGDSDIEVLLNRSEPPRKSRIPNPFSAWKQPRITLRFTHELSTKDLTIENLNRHLATAVEVTPLVPPATSIGETNSTSTQASTGPAPANQPAEAQPAQPIRKDEPKPAAEPVLTPSIVADLPVAGPDIGELTVECSVRGARVYIDGSYSGVAPRTLRLRAGVHTILVVSDGNASWEQKLMVPGAKISALRVELQR
jgi:hypothetical protein